jgi:hypothetical protein
MRDFLSPPSHDGTLLVDACCPISVREWITGFCDLLMENSPSWSMCLGFLVRILVLLSMIWQPRHCYVQPQTTSLVVQSVMTTDQLCYDKGVPCLWIRWSIVSSVYTFPHSLGMLYTPGNLRPTSSLLYFDSIVLMQLQVFYYMKRRKVTGVRVSQWSDL